MPTRKTTFRHVFGGGWATDFGPNAEVSADENGRLVIPFLRTAQNLFYEFDGGPHKIGGTTRSNTTVIDSGNQIRGLYDFWRQGTGGSPAQKLIAYAGTDLWQGGLDADLVSMSQTLTEDDVVSFATFDDFLIISFEGSDVPKSWDQTTIQTLSAGAPNFAFSATHKNRLWAAGVAATPSRLHYSALLDPEDWTGAGSGFIDIDPNDGDKITAIASHKDNLWVFKGPYKGSIHRIAGSAPTGGDAFSRQTFVQGVGAVAQNLLFHFRDDLGFVWSDGTVHSLAATASFADFDEATLSRPINSWLRDNLTLGSLKGGWSVTDVSRGYVLFTLPHNTSTDNSIHLLMDYRFNPVRWALWDAFDSGSLASVVDGSLPTIMSGSNDGWVRRIQNPSRSIDATTSISYEFQTAFLNYGNPINLKQLERASLGISPKGVYDMTFAWTRDDNAEQTQTVSQGVGAVLAGSASFGTVASMGNAADGHVNVTALSHGLSNGTVVSISGSAISAYNGTFTVLEALGNSFHIEATQSGNTSGGMTWRTSPTANFFILDTSKLGGATFVDRYMSLETAGEFRNISYGVRDTSINQDIEVHTISATIGRGADSTEN